MFSSSYGMALHGQQQDGAESGKHLLPGREVLFSEQSIVISFLISELFLYFLSSSPFHSDHFLPFSSNLETLVYVSLEMEHNINGGLLESENSQTHVHLPAFFLRKLAFFYQAMD